MESDRSVTTPTRMAKQQAGVGEKTRAATVNLSRHEQYRRDRFKLITATVRAIVASRYCHAYLIGYTSGSYWPRYRTHLSYGYKHFAVIANGMRFNDALNLEMMLQRSIKRGNKHSVLYRKYEPKARDDYSRRSGHRGG